LNLGNSLDLNKKKKAFPTKEKSCVLARYLAGREFHKGLPSLWSGELLSGNSIVNSCAILASGNGFTVLFGGRYRFSEKLEGIIYHVKHIILIFRKTGG
jgi:hypothetical protein